MSGLITQHKDVWDALDNNQFPSPEAIILLVQKVMIGQNIIPIHSNPGKAPAHVLTCVYSMWLWNRHSYCTSISAGVLARPGTFSLKESVFLTYTCTPCHTGSMFLTPGAGPVSDT